METTLIADDDARLMALVNDWHEAGRADFQAAYQNLDYDSEHYAKSIVGRKKYICLDDGTSGAFMLDRATGEVFCIKGYGTPDKRKRVGVLGELTGADLLRCRHWKLR